MAFAVLFILLQNHDPASFAFNSPTRVQYSKLAMPYYSVVTFPTLGFGDITQHSDGARLAVMAEVVLGYVRLGGLISIFANLITRRF
ncbi:MAG: hypothetical protein KQJ78_14900 [Deltaproteobacteria bacterium]|nr:hypothetical protein [Deltaproteobacteria bacterium]